jgi:hypothetical protein
VVFPLPGSPAIPTTDGVVALTLQLWAFDLDVYMTNNAARPTNRLNRWEIQPVG